jgi:hypothetical protein
MEPQSRTALPGKYGGVGPDADQYESHNPDIPCAWRARYRDRRCEGVGEDMGMMIFEVYDTHINRLIIVYILLYMYQAAYFVVSPLKYDITRSGDFWTRRK